MPVTRHAPFRGRLDWLHLSADPGLSDGKLLERFILQRDEGAFAALVQRHGRMVQGVCRRVLGNRHDVEDAFQATFVVLVRKATSIVPRERVGNWLYGVAYNVAIKSRALSARRQALERQRREMAAEQPTELSNSGLHAALDEELTRLPERYRMPIVLCDLEGRSRKEVARHLGWKEGTLSGRLARGRVLLAKRLRRHGMALSVAGLALALAAESRAAAPLAHLARSTTKAALAAVGDAGLAGGLLSSKAMLLANEVAKGFLLCKLKKMMVASLICIVAVGTGLVGIGLPGKTGSEPQVSLATGPTLPLPAAKLETEAEPAPATMGLPPQPFVFVPMIDLENPTGSAPLAQPSVMLQVSGQLSWPATLEGWAPGESSRVWVFAVVLDNSKLVLPATPDP